MIQKDDECRCKRLVAEGCIGAHAKICGLENMRIELVNAGQR
jgi:hypothetical protein